MDFKFKIESISSGWVEMSAAGSGNIFPMKVSNKSDPFEELPDMLIKLNALYSSGDNFSDSPNDGLYLFWEGDNSQYTLKFTPLKKRIVKIEISLCENVNAGIHIKDFVSISAEVLLDELIRSVYDEMLSLLRKHGFLGYRSEWRKSCFPICYFLQLHKLANGESMKASGFLDELAILSSIGKSS
ncbi:MAG: hypothetical protein WAX69_05840 [Victivallales bacterium]